MRPVLWMVFGLTTAPSAAQPAGPQPVSATATATPTATPTATIVPSVPASEAAAGWTEDGHDAVLQSKIETRIAGFDGIVGVYVRHLPTGRWAAVRPDSLFPTASMVKVPIMAAVFQQIEAGTLDYRQALVYRDSLHYPGQDLVGAMKDGSEIALDRLLLASLALSDNTASLWLQHLAGTGAGVNDWLESAGYAATRVNSRTAGRRPDWERYGWGQTTPREMARLVAEIRAGRVVSPAASERMYRLMTRNHWDGEALSQIPPSVQAASKNGAVSASRSEVVLVNAPGGDYVFCVITSDQADTSWGDDNAGYELIRTLSRLFWQHFEPDSGWRPEARK